ncbi:MAG: hypothetical protein ACLUD0_05375 [Eubacterium ramulus]
MMMIMYALTVAIVWVAAKKIDLGVMQVGSMTAFITYAMLIVMAFLMLTAMSVMLPRAGVAADRIDEGIKYGYFYQRSRRTETMLRKQQVS